MRAFVSSLACISAATLLSIAVWTRGSSPLLRVEERIATLRELAEQKALPPSALIALCWLDERQQTERTDDERASALRSALDRAQGELEGAFEVLIPAVVERRMTLDLMRRKTERWRKLAAK